MSGMRASESSEQYLEALNGCPDLILPKWRRARNQRGILFVLRHFAVTNCRHLSEAGIGTLVHLSGAPHLSGAYAEGG